MSIGVEDLCMKCKYSCKDKRIVLCSSFTPSSLKIPSCYDISLLTKLQGRYINKERYNR